MPSSSRTEDPRGPALVWFRDDLRLADNPALTAAAAGGRPVAALYVLDEASPGLRRLGGARRWWLHHSLAALGAELGRHGIRLILRRGAAGAVVPAVAQAVGACAVHWNRRYELAAREIDAGLKAAFAARGLEVASHQANLLHEPWTLKTRAGEPFRVYSPFWRAAQAAEEPRAPLPVPAALAGWTGTVDGEALEDWSLTPRKPDWAGGLRDTWTPGEAGAHARLAAFLETGLAAYAEERDRPDRPSTSGLSPHLAFGEVSPFQLRAAALLAAEDGPRRPARRHVDKFLSEIGWREFAWHLLHHWPDLATVNFQRRFDAFPWARDEGLLRAWQRGLTGIPLVDAGMRQLWTTGWMHNRVRMVVASFLVKHLLQDWRAGEAWFWDTLVDADPANNAASWQWVAGSGADAAPYFRVFNPVLQGEKFDPEGSYVRRHVPELARLPARFVHRPWEAPAEVLRAAGLRLGRDYPLPVVDLNQGRDRALTAFETLKSDQDAA
ncbi:cryptochrome/photolyase family protein [Prosthecomicrobium sp. N25]|uniref:cryptochrome/photolyase family protein n=1 Tax=Prosthecomicrobium sp. N25 TaxID=3129254 RepID=UPI0030783CA5